MLYIYLGISIGFILFCLVVFLIVKKLFQWIDKVSLGEQMSDIKHDAELVKDVREFKETNADDIEAANSNEAKDL